MKQSRRAARSLAFQVLYSLSFNTPDNLEILQADFAKAANMKDIVGKFEQDKVEKKEQDEAQELPSGFAWDLVYGVWSHQAELDKIISSFSERWKVERLGRIELTLLRMGMFELHHDQGVPI